MNDFCRVATHEFGHTLGLGHPDEAGQAVNALMNSTISDLDHLTADDISGAQALYPATPTGGGAFQFIASTGSGSGNEFKIEQLTANPSAETVLSGGDYFFTSLDFTPAGELFAVDYTASLYRINTSTWTPTLVTTIHTSGTGSPTWYGMAFAPDGRLFGVANDALYTINTTTGLATLVATFPPYVYIFAIAFAPDGTLYGAENELYQLNPSNAQVIQAIGWLGTNATIDISVAADGNIYGVCLDHRTLVRLDKNTAQVTVLGTYTSQIWGLTTTPVANVPPSITGQPQSQTVTAGTSVTFSVTASGTAPLSYQWYRNGSPIAGATAASFTLGSAQPSDAANYQVRVSNVAGAVDSTTATLAVESPPVITAQPQSLTLTIGANATFAVVAIGIPTPTYQWQCNGVNIPGATSSSYTRANVQFTDAGSYAVVVSNPVGSVTSPAAVLTVNAPPSITAQPQSQTAIAGDNATFTVAADGTAPLTYQWSFNGNPIPAASQASYIIAGVTADDAGTYSVAIANAVGQTRSANAALAVLVPLPGIYNTGLSDSHSLLADGLVDPHYKLVVNPDNPASIASVVQDSMLFPIVGGPWIQNSSTSKWIGPARNTIAAAAGNYSYQLAVDLTGYDPRTAVLAGRWATDDTGSIFLNGADTGISTTNFFLSFSTFTLTNGFASGINLVEFRVSNGASWTGLRVENLRGGAQPQNATPFPPLLSVTRLAPNALTLSWPYPSAGFGLQQNAALSTTSWINLTNSPVQVGGAWQVTVSLTGGCSFFRLRGE